MNNMILIKNLYLDFKDKNHTNKIIFNDMNLSIEKNDLVYIMGKNGCGKSTLFNVMTNDISIDKGKVSTNGKIVYQRQFCTLFENMTVKENIESFRIFFKNNKLEFIEKLIEMLEIKNIERSVVEKLSGGEKQKLVLLITLLREGDIYIFDEADSALDPSNRYVYSKVIDYLKKHDKTIIFSSHHIKESISNATRLLLIHNKKVYEIKKECIENEILNYTEHEFIEYITKKYCIGGE